MKKLIFILLFIVFMVQPCLGAFTDSIDSRRTYKNAYRWTGKPKDKILNWAGEVEDRLTGATSVEFTFYEPTDTEPATNEGTIYYDLSEHKLKYRNAGAWVAIESGSAGNSLDGAYDIGRTISVDAGSVILTGTDAADNVVLSLIQSDTGTVKGFTITNAGTGNTIDIQGQSSSKDIEGTDDSWSISSIGSYVGVIGTWTGDQTWTGSAANVLFDATDDELLIEDDAILSFGDVADVTITWNASNLLIEAATDNVGQIQLGATNSMDLKILGSTITDIALFDASEGMLILDSYPIALGDGDAILLGDALGTGDFSIASTSAVLAYTQVSADTGEITYGASGTDIPIKWFAETTSNWVYFNVDEVEFEDVVLQMMDATQIQFGDGDDFGIHSTTAKKLQFSPAANTDDYEVLMGVDQSGVDLKLFGATTGEYWLWDASADSILPVCGNVLYTLTDAEADQFKVNATGATSDAVAINLKTTDGKILLNADGATGGDIELNAVDDIILTTTGKLTITNTEAMTVSGASTLTGAVTGTAGIQSAAVAITATTEVTQTTIVAGSRWVTVTSDTATKVIILPTAVVGNIIDIQVIATGAELQTGVSGSDQINGVDCSGANEMAMTAGSVYTLKCAVANKWIATGVSAAGARQATIVPDTDS